MTLDEIIYLAKNKSFTIPSVESFRNIRQDLFWSPEVITPWFYLESYHQLPKEIKLRYNQYYALAVNEIFALFETDFLVKAMDHLLLKIENNSEHQKLKEALTFFRDEEFKHSEMFWRLSEGAASELYPQRDYQFVNKASWIGRRILNVVTKFPDFFLMWVWMAIFFEERTLMYSKRFIDGARNFNQLEANFTLAHRLHLIEEVRHVHTDQILLEHVYDHQPMHKRTLAGLMMKRMVKDFASPRRMSYVIADKLEVEFSEFKNYRSNLFKELPGLSKNQEFHKMLFGPEATERTRTLMEFYPEFNGIWDCLSY